MCDMTRSHVWHDSFTYVTWLIHMCDMTRFSCVTWLIHMCDMTHSHVWHDSFLMSDMTHSHMWHDSFTCVTWLVSYEWHDSFTCVTWLIHIFDMTRSYACHNPRIFVTRLVHGLVLLTGENSFWQQMNSNFGQKMKSIKAIPPRSTTFSSGFVGVSSSSGCSV